MNAIINWEDIDTAPNGQRVLLWDKWDGLATCGRVCFDANGGYEVTTDIDAAFRASHWALIVGPKRSKP